LLTDRNLKDMVDWVQSKTALQRFRDGWGVVCGLDVACSHKPKEYGRVYVSSGYAVDCCGRDIVVCDPLWYDFRCDSSDNPCCCPKKKKDHAAPGNVEGHEPEGSLGCIPVKELRAFDLCLKFAEKLTGGQRAPSRGDCQPMGECQYTRVRENGKLYAKEIPDACTETVHKVDEKYRRQLKDYIEALQKNAYSPKALLEYVEGRLSTFCFVHECLCKLVRSKDQLPQNWATEFLFYIIQDFRNKFFECLCESCMGNSCDGDGVPLARVWVWDRQEKDCRLCKVVYVDPFPPYRRPLGRDCYSGDPGCIDLSRYIWQRREVVREQLCRHGFRNVGEAEFQPARIVDLGDAEDKDLICAPCGSGLTVRFIKDHCGRDRVVTFERGNNL
jgi:hypothetical protein